MSTTQIKKTGLFIAGTKTRQGGFAPIMSIGILAAEERDKMDRSSMLQENPIYVIKHTADYVLYGIIDRKVKPADRDTAGVLSIALTVPRGVQLDNKRSPYDLLQNVYETFKNRYMQQTAEGEHRFVNTEVDRSLFEAILEGYPAVEKPSGKYVSMNPTGPTGVMCVGRDKMAELFLDSQYDEFAGFKDIEIGFGCHTNEELKNVEIPRPIVYKIIVNDKYTGTDLKYPQNLNSLCEFSNYLRDTEDLRYAKASFDLEQLLAAPNNRLSGEGYEIVLDLKTERIKCKIESYPINYTVTVNVDSKSFKHDKIQELLESGHIRFVFGDEESHRCTSGRLTFKIPVSVARQTGSIQVKQDGSVRGTHGIVLPSSVIPSKDTENRTMEITLKGEKVPSPISSSAASVKSPGGTAHGKTTHSGTSGQTSGGAKKTDNPKKPNKNDGLFTPRNIVIVAGALLVVLLGILFLINSNEQEKKAEQDMVVMYESLIEDIKISDKPDTIKDGERYKALDTDYILKTDSAIDARNKDLKKEAKELEKARIKKAEEEAAAAAQKAEEEAAAAKKKAEEEAAAAKAKAEKEAAARKKAEENANVKIVLEEYVNKGIKLKKLREKVEYQALSQEIRVTIESVLDTKKYPNELESKIVIIRNNKFSSLNDIENARKKIEDLLSDMNYKLDKKTGKYIKQ